MNKGQVINNIQEEFCMKNVLKAFGIIALAAVIGFSMVACGGTYEEID